MNLQINRSVESAITRYDEIQCTNILLIKELTVIILDVGKNAAERETKDGPSFFEQAKNCVEKILLRKVNS